MRSQLEQLAEEIERVSDLVMVHGDTSEPAQRTWAAQRGALENYFASLRSEQRSMERHGGVTVLDTTARIHVIPGATSKTEIVGELHVTRTVAELPAGDRWEEVLPISLTADAQGKLTVTQVGTDDLVQALTAPATPPVPDQSEVPATYEPESAATERTIRVNKTKAVNYAKKWWNRRNPDYPTRYANDCTNFVSQVMHQGGWHPVPGWYTSDRAWWYNGIPHGSRTWGGAENFYRFAVHESQRARPLRNVADLWLGDILQYKKKGEPRINHTMVVTNWINKVPHLTYHTNDTLNKPFTSRAGMSVTWFASRT